MNTSLDFLHTKKDTASQNLFENYLTTTTGLVGTAKKEFMEKAVETFRKEKFSNAHIGAAVSKLLSKTDQPVTQEDIQGVVSFFNHVATSDQLYTIKQELMKTYEYLGGPVLETATAEI